MKYNLIAPCVVLLMTMGCATPSVAELRDPTRPLLVLSKNGTETKKDEKFILQSIISSKNKISALINNQRLVVGDSIYGMKVASIQTNHVVLLNPSGNQIRLFLFSPIKK